MTLQRSREAIADAKRALEELKAARSSTEEFPYRFRTCIALLMAVGPTMATQTPNAPPGWWEPLLSPDAARLMSLRKAVLKQTRNRLDPNFQPDDPMTTLQRFSPRGGSRVVDPSGARVRTYSPAWQITGSDFGGHDPVQVITAFLDRLEQKVMPQAERYM